MLSVRPLTPAQLLNRCIQRYVWHVTRKFKRVDPTRYVAGGEAALSGLIQEFLPQFNENAATGRRATVATLIKLFIAECSRTQVFMHRAGYVWELVQRDLRAHYCC